MSHEKFVRTLFEELNNKNITYCVLKNYDGLPHSSTRDIDIWVKKDDLLKFHRLLFKLADRLGWEFVTYSSRISYYKEGEYCFKKNNLICSIDFSAFNHWKSFSYIDNVKLEKNIRYHRNGFYIPSTGVEACALLFRGTGLLQNSAIPYKYVDKIYELVKNDPEEFIDVIEKPIGGQLASEICNLILSKDWDNLHKYENTIKKALIFNSFKHDFIYQVKMLILLYYERLKKHLFPNHGCFLVFFGPDGSGKTTTAEAILRSKNIKRIFSNREYTYRRFNYPKIKWLTNKINVMLKYPFKGYIKSNSANMNNYNSDYKNTSMIYVAYLGIEYILGHFYIRRKKSNCSLIIFDRYFYDYMLFKENGKCPKFIFKIFFKLIPEPDLIIHLQNEPDVILKRKNELTIEEIYRQLELCNYITKGKRNICNISTNEEVDEIVEKIQTRIISILRTKL